MLALESGGGGIGGDGGADKIFPVSSNGVLLSQKTHGLLLASVTEISPSCRVTEIRPSFRSLIIRYIF